MTPHKCPETHDLQSFVRFQLSDEEFHSIVEHLSSCPTCDETVCNLEKQSETIADRIRRQPPIPFSDEPECQRLLAKIKAGELSSAGRTFEDRTAVAPPRVVRDYELLELLGQGGMGHVYRAVHQRLKRPVAIKLLTTGRLKDQAAVARFEREMLVLGRLVHPHIVQAQDAGEHDGQHYLVMEYVDGVDLGVLVHQRGRLPIPEACRVIQQAATALQYAHERGCVHRDIKPSNLMLAKTDHGAMVKVLDLGLARALEVDGDHTQQVTELTSADQIMGTLDYMAPEQGSDSHVVDIRADIYSLGATLYKLLTGHAPHAAHAGKSPLQRLMAIATSEPPHIQSKRSEIPAALAAIIHKMLAKQPEDRFKTPAEVAIALEPFAVGANLSTLLSPKADTAVLASEPTAVLQSSPTPPPSRRSPWLRAFFGAAGVLLLGVILSVTTKNGTITVESPDGKLPADLKIVVSDEGNEVAILQADNNWSVTVTHGEFQVAVADQATGFQLEDSHVIVKRLGKTLLTVRKAVEPVTPEVVETPATQPVDHGLVLTGENSFVQLHQMPPIPAPLTLEAWVELKDRKKGHLIFVGAPLWVTLEIHDEKWAMSVVRPDQTTSMVTTSEPASLNELVHVAGCWDGQNATLFVNGKPATVTRPETGFAWPGYQNVFLGRNMTAGSPGVAAVVKGVRISQVVRYKNEFAPEQNWQTDADTLGLYRCIERQGLGLADYSGHGRHGTVFGTSWVPLPATDWPPTPTVFAVIRPSKAEREFSDLSEAIKQTQAGDVVEIRSQQVRLPVRFTEPLFHPLILRAGKGIRPQLILEGIPQAGLGQDITFEGVDLDLRDVIWFSEPHFTHSVTYRRCRVWGYLANIPGKRVEFKDSIIVPFEGVLTGYEENPDPVEAVFDNCAIRVFTDLMRATRGRHRLALRNCSVMAEDRGSPSLVGLHGEGNTAHIDIESTGCLYHCRSQTDGLIDKRFLPQVTWKGTENCYSGDLYTVREVGPNGEWIGVKEQGLEAWKKLWPEPEQNSRLVNLVKLKWGESLQGSYHDRQHRLQTQLDSLRMQADLKDNGPDWLHLGPGDAYVRTLRAEGRSIADSDLLPQPPTDGPCVLIRDRTVQRGYVTLQEAVDAALSGDVIEIRKSGSLAGCTLRGESRLLTLRAGLGFQPVIDSMPLYNSGTDRLILEGLTVDKTVFGSAGSPPPNWNGTDPAFSLFPGQGTIVRVRNCRINGSISGWMDAIDGTCPEITNTECRRVIVGIRSGEQARLVNSMTQAITVETESATSNPATFQVSHCAVFAPFPDLYTIHSAFVANTPMRLDVQNSSLTASRDLLFAHQVPVKWSGARNIYRIGHSFGPRNFPHEGNWQSAVKEEGSIQFVPFEFGPGTWRIVPEVSTGYERRLDGKDFGVDVERLTHAFDRWYAE